MASRRKQWTDQEQKLLFQLHKEYGNKWAVISTKMQDKDDSCIKNKFYSTLRKGLRKINSYITNVKKKSDPVKFKAFKVLPELFLTKMISVVDHNFDQKFEVKQRAIDLAPNIQERIVSIAFCSIQYLKPQCQDYDYQQELLADIHQFNKNCKKRKGKRKLFETKDSLSENECSSPFIGNKIEISQMLDSSNQQVKVMTKKKSALGKRKSQIEPQKEVKNENPDIKIPEEVFFKSTCSSSIEKKASMATTVLANDSMNFANKAEELLRVMEDNPLYKSNYSLSNSWIIDSSNSLDISKKSGFYLQPSPLPTDIYSSYFNSFMKSKNAVNSSIFEQKNNSVDLFASGKIYPNKREDNVLSLVDRIPLFQSNTANFLIKSSDLQRSTQLPDLNKDSYAPALEPKPENFVNQFLSGFNFINYTGSYDQRMKDYSFGCKSDIVQMKGPQGDQIKEAEPKIAENSQKSDN